MTMWSLAASYSSCGQQHGACYTVDQPKRNTCWQPWQRQQPGSTSARRPRWGGSGVHERRQHSMAQQWRFGSRGSLQTRCSAQVRGPSRGQRPPPSCSPAAGSGRLGKHPRSMAAEPQPLCALAGHCSSPPKQATHRIKEGLQLGPGEELSRALEDEVGTQLAPLHLRGRQNRRWASATQAQAVAW